MVDLVCFVSLVDLVHLVSFHQPNKPSTNAVWRRRAGSNRCIAVLQTAPLTTWVRRPARIIVWARGERLEARSTACWKGPELLFRGSQADPTAGSSIPSPRSNGPRPPHSLRLLFPWPSARPLESAYPSTLRSAPC